MQISCHKHLWKKAFLSLASVFFLQTAHAQSVGWAEIVLGQWELTNTTILKSEDVLFPSKYDVMPDAFLEELKTLSLKGEQLTFLADGQLELVKAGRTASWYIDQQSRLCITDGLFAKEVHWDFLASSAQMLKLGIYIRGYDVNMTLVRQ